MPEQVITQEQLFVPLLWFIADRDGVIDRQGDNLLEALAAELGLTEWERHRETEGGRDQWRSTVENCRRKLVARGLIETGERGVWPLTEAGLRQARNPPAEWIEEFEVWLSGREEPRAQHRRRIEASVETAAPDGRDVGQEEEDEDSADTLPETEVRESTLIQALLATIGAQMGLGVWLPRPDRARVLEHSDCSTLVERLPMSFAAETLRTVELIDVLWLRGLGVVRAFEVEHTTAVYSGLLRMADLLTLQPNLSIDLHIVAPVSRRTKVFAEIRRPVFVHLPSGPLSQRCTFLSYEAVRGLAEEAHLSYLSDSVLDEYAEEAG